MPWADLEEVEYAARRRVVRDGRLVLFPRDLEGELAMLGPAGRRHARLTERMLGAPFAMPLGLTTRVLGAGGDLSGALATLADGRCEIVEIVPGADDSAEDGRRRGVRRRRTGGPLRLLRAARGRRSPSRSLSTARWPPSWTPEATQSMELPAVPHAESTFVIGDLAAIEAVDTEDRSRAGCRPRAAPALCRPARRAHPHPPPRHRGDRDRRLRAVRWRLLRPGPPAHAGPGARRRRRAAARDLRRHLRRRADRPAPGLRGRARHRSAAARSAGPAAARTGRSSSPPS